MKNHFIILVSIVLVCSACKQSSNSNTISNKGSNYLFLNKSEIDAFISNNSISNTFDKNMQSFYMQRNFAFAWIDATGANEYASNFINLLNQKKDDSKATLYANKLQTLYSSVVNGNSNFSKIDKRLVELEMLFTTTFFYYAQNNWGGITDDNVKSMNWFISKKSMNFSQLLDSVLRNKPNQFAQFEPLYRQYSLLKTFLEKFKNIQRNNTWIVLPSSILQLKLGINLPVISSIKKQLYVFEDLKINDTTTLFNDDLKVAIQKFQKRNGIESTGVIDTKTIEALRITMPEHIQKIMINMERCKWVPAQQNGDYLVVNIPAYKLYVYQNDSLKWSCDVVVGKTLETSNTVIFSDSLEYVVFSPYWNVPNSIVVKDLIPALKKNRNYLQRLNMEVVDNTGNLVKASSIHWKNYSNNFPFIIRQKPGAKNSLGLVKFIFPNKYDIYLHDTPQKYLFDETARGFSHGCIRIEKPFELAKFLLRTNKIYTDEKIHQLMNSGKQTYVKLKTKVPVYIGYFTAWVDREGVLNFRDDIYHYDEKMKALLFR